MSIRVMTMVWEKSHQKGSALLLLLAIADFADDAGAAYPSIETLSTKIRMSERNTRYVLSGLIDSGELAIKRGGGRGGSNVYRVLVEKNLPLFEPDAPQEKGAKIAGAKIAPAAGSRETLQPVAVNPAIAIAPEPSITVREPSSTPGQSRVRKGKSAIPPEFGISEPVRSWAREHGYESYLQAHLEYFTDYARSNGKLYADWDGAFRNCIRSDWGGVRKNAGRGGAARRPTDTTCQDRVAGEPCGMAGKLRGDGKSRCDHHEFTRQERTRAPMPAETRAFLDKIKTRTTGRGPRPLFARPIRQEAGMHIDDPKDGQEQEPAPKQEEPEQQAGIR